MRKTSLRPIGLCLWLLLLLPQLATSEEIGDTTEAQVEVPLTPAERLAKAQEAFRQALKQEPQPLAQEPGKGPSADERAQLGDRMGNLENSIFSNREWSGWWEAQSTAALELAEAMAAHPPPRARAAKPWATRIEGLKRWSRMTTQNVEAHAQIFQALQLGKDALEERMETVLGRPDDSLTPPKEKTDPNPYEQRSFELEELEYLIATQERRLEQAQANLRFVVREHETAEALQAAKIARNKTVDPEESIAREMAAINVDGMAPLWAKAANRASSRRDRLLAGLAAHQSMLRQLDVEKELLSSEVGFRQRQLEKLQADLVAKSDVSTLIEATKETAFDWLISKAPRIFLVLFLIWVGMRIALRVMSRGLSFLSERISADGGDAKSTQHRSKTLVGVFSGVMRLAIYALAALMALEQLGVNTAPILGSVAVLGLAISFGSQNLVRDVVNGFFLLLEDQYSVGDMVTINGCTGGVQAITIRTTTLRHGASGKIHTIPNGTIKMVTNHNRSNGAAMCDYGVSYGADLAQVKEVIMGVCEELKQDEKWGSKIVNLSWFGVQSLDDSAVTVRVKLDTVAMAHWGVHRELNERVKLALDAAGIDIPYPQRVIHQAS